MPLYCNTSAHEHELGAERTTTTRSLLHELYGSHAIRYTSTSNCSPQPQIKPIKSDVEHEWNGSRSPPHKASFDSTARRERETPFWLYDVCECLRCDGREACVNLLNYGSNCTWISRTRLLATDWYQPEQMSYLCCALQMNLWRRSCFFYFYFSFIFFCLVLELINWKSFLWRVRTVRMRIVCIIRELGNVVAFIVVFLCVRLDYLCLQTCIVDLNDSSSTANVTYFVWIKSYAT